MEHTRSSGQSADTQPVDNGWLAALRGYLAATAGLPGDIEGLGRAGINLARSASNGKRVDPAPALPTTEFYRDWLPGKQVGDSSTVEQLAGLPAGAKITSAPRAFINLGKAISSAKALPDIGLAKQAGIFIGPNASIWDAAKAKQAEQMLAAGADPRDVWKATGTLTSHPDKVWRQEISDRGAKFNTTNELFDKSYAVNKERFALKDQLKQSLESDKLNKDLFPSTLAPARNMARQQVKAMSDLETNLTAVAPRAANVIDHPELYNAYPKLANISVEQGRDMGQHALGQLNVPTNEMRIFSAGVARNPKSTALHEMQHAVQEIEGMSPGSSPMDFLRARDKAEIGVDRINGELSRLAKKIELADSTGDKAMVKEFQGEYNTLLSDRSKLIDAARFDPHEGYRRAGGETESRATQARLDLTADERLKTCPLDSYDYTPEQLIMTPPGRSGSALSVERPSLSLEAIRYDKTPRTVIDTEHFGGGLKGSSRDEYLNAADKRLAKRTYFYADKGEGIQPEAGVGGIAHRAQLSNVYDADTDPLRLMYGSKLENESRILDRGYSGYLNRLEGSQPGQVVMLGSQTIPAEVLGPMSRSSAKPVPPAGARPSKGRDTIIDQVSANKALPGGSLTPFKWQQYLDPDISKALGDAGVFSDTTPMYKSELLKRFRERTPSPDYSVPDAPASPTIDLHDRWGQYQEKSSQIGDGYIRWVEDPTTAYVTDIQAGPKTRGSSMLDWLKSTTKKDPYAVGVVDDSVGFWDKMLDAGKVSGQTDEDFMSFFGKSTKPKYRNGGLVPRPRIPPPLATVQGFDPVYKRAAPDVTGIAKKLVDASWGKMSLDHAIAMAETYRPKGV